MAKAEASLGAFLFFVTLKKQFCSIGKVARTVRYVAREDIGEDMLLRPFVSNNTSQLCNSHRVSLH